MKRIIAPSMLAADFGHLARDTRMVDRSAAGWIHIDVMDGVFVPNISFGFPVLAAIKKESDKFLDVHLMIVEPERYVERFARAGASLITFHAEAVEDPRAVVELIHGCGVKAGVSIKPATPVEDVYRLLDVADLVLIMSVEPGFGGQSFIEGSVEKVRRLRREIETRGSKTLIEIDGGIGTDNAGMLFEAGCDVLVAGSAVFGATDPEAAIVEMLNG